MRTMKDLLAQVRGETRQRELMARRAEAEALRADTAERSVRTLAAENERLRRRIAEIEAELKSVGRR